MKSASEKSASLVSRPRRWARIPLLALFPFLLASCLPEGLQIPESPLLRTLERQSGLIAFVGTDYNIYTIDQGGGNLVALTEDALPPTEGSDTRIYQFPSWSPVDDRLAFVGIRGPSGSFDEVTVYIANPDGSDLHEVSTHPEEMSYYLYWAPDGKKISILARTASGLGGILKLVPVDGGETQIIDTGTPYYWDWSPDASQLLIHAGASTDGRISLLTPGEVVEESGLNYVPGIFQAPAWSPDGERLLIAVQNEAGQDELILADDRGNKIESLVEFEGSIAFGWSPDGEKIAYLTDENFSTLGTLGPLTILELDRLDEPILVTDQLVYSFYWAPDSEKIAYFVPAIPAQEEGVESQEEPPVLLQAYVRELEQDESTLLMTFLPTEAFALRMPNFDQYHHSDTFWSPDSRALVVSAFSSSGEPTIWVVPASGGIPPRYIADGHLAFWSWK